VKLKHRRLLIIIGGFTGLGLSAFFTLRALQDNLIYFYRPSDLASKKISSQERIRVGGQVMPGSLTPFGKGVRFRITDQHTSLWVISSGLLPDLFREGQGIVAEGFLQDPHVFQATSVLVKHDENYRPPDAR